MTNFIEAPELDLNGDPMVVSESDMTLETDYTREEIVEEILDLLDPDPWGDKEAHALDRAEDQYADWLMRD